MRARLVLAGLTALAFAACSGSDGPSDPGGGSNATGSLRGSVTNNTGGPIAGAQVRLTGNNQTARNATSAADGSYSFTNVRVGSYSVAVTPPSGFALSGPGTRAVTVTANQEANVNAFVLVENAGGGPPLLVDVVMTNLSFSPSTVTVAVGGTVRWTNNDATQHNATGPGISTGNMDGGAVREEVMTTPGTIDYSCTLHPGMNGRVIVQ